MNRFTYLPGPGDYTIMLLDPHSSFATIDWERIGWEEAVRRANLFCSAPEMHAQLDNLRTMLDEALTYLDLADVDILIFKQIIKDIETLLAKAEGKEAQDGRHQ